METICRSNSAMTFDGCPACAGAALDAVAQAGIYLLGRTAPDLAHEASGPLDRTYSLRVRLCSRSGEEIASDEIEVSQTISVVPLRHDLEASTDMIGEGEPTDELGDADAMKLEDFQTVLDRLELGPTDDGSIKGVIGGDLYGFDRFIGPFEIQVSPLG